MIKKILLLVTFFYFQWGFAQNAVLSDNSKISLLTCGSGSELYSAFGHTALRIQDPSIGLDVVYNYGTFDFRTEHFYLKFIKGDLNYFVSISTFTDFITEYQYDQRSVIEQILRLSLIQKQDLFDKLNTSLYSDERFYTYKFIDRNCTTMVLDKLNQTIKNKTIVKTAAVNLSYREVLYPYFEDYYWFKLGINIIFGAPTDVADTQLFLPIELQNSVEKLVVNKEPIVEKTQILVEGQTQKRPFSFWNSGYFFGLLLLLIGLTRSSKIYFIYLFLLGAIGLFFSFAGLYSHHKEITWNYHILLFNPLFVLFPFIYKTRYFKKILLTCALCLGIFILYVLTLPQLVLISPIILLNIWMLWFFYKKLNKLK
jgi:hypothetical protein